MNNEWVKHLIRASPYILIAWIGNRMSLIYHRSEGLAGEKLMYLLTHMKDVFSGIMPSFMPADLLIGLAAAITVRLIIYYRHLNAKHYRQGVEYGSARWGTRKDILPYLDKDPEKNVILTQTEGLSMNSRPKNPKYARNKNVIVIGGSGSGKTRFFVKPNLMQMHSSYCVTDPKGTILVECGKMLQRAGYSIKVLNTINFRKSHHYNPFEYIRSEKDILKLANTIIANTKGEGEKSTEDFWVSATCSQTVKKSAHRQETISL